MSKRLWCQFWTAPCFERERSSKRLVKLLKPSESYYYPHPRSLLSNPLSHSFLLQRQSKCNQKPVKGRLKFLHNVFRLNGNWSPVFLRKYCLLMTLLPNFLVNILGIFLIGPIFLYDYGVVLSTFGSKLYCLCLNPCLDTY